MLLSLDKKEERDLRKFLRSPYFNLREDVAHLFEYLLRLKSKGEHPPEKSALFQAIYGDQPYEDHRMRMLASMLLKLIERYLVVRSVEDQELEYKTRLAAVFRKRNLPRHLETTLRQLEELQEKGDYRNAEFYDYRFRAEFERYQYAAANRRTDHLNLQDLADQLDLAYMARKLRQTCFSLSHQAVYRTEYRFGLIQELLAYIDQENWQRIPAVGIYYHCYLALVHPEEEEHFLAFRRQIREFGHQFPPFEIRNLYLLAINYCIKKYNAGDKAYLEEELQLYREGLEKGYLLINDHISRFTFRNVVTIGLIMKEYDWVERFIEEYRDRLEDEYRESMYSFCRANLEYERKQYDKALQLLQKSEYRDLLLNLAAKTLLLRIFFELGEYALLDSHLEAMRSFIRRKDIISYHKENYLNTIAFTKKLMNLGYDPTGREALRTQIAQTSALAEREWLLEQI